MPHLQKQIGLQAAAPVFKKTNGGNTAILTWLPDALWIGQGVTENPLMPKSTKTMDDITSLVKNLTLHFVFGTI